MSATDRTEGLALGLDIPQLAECTICGHRTSYVPRPPADWPICVPCYALSHIRTVLSTFTNDDPRWTGADMALAQCHYLLSALSTSSPLPPLPYPCTRPTEAIYEMGPSGLYPRWPADPVQSIQSGPHSDALDTNGAQWQWLARDLQSGTGGLPHRHPYPSAFRELMPARWWPDHQMPVPGGYHCARLRPHMLATLSHRSLLRPTEEPLQYDPSLEPPQLTHWAFQQPLRCRQGMTADPATFFSWDSISPLRVLGRHPRTAPPAKPGPELLCTPHKPPPPCSSQPDSRFMWPKWSGPPLRSQPMPLPSPAQPGATHTTEPPATVFRGVADRIRAEARAVALATPPLSHLRQLIHSPNPRSASPQAPSAPSRSSRSRSPRRPRPSQ